jgi:Tol biopolymer transport system component
MPARPPTRPVGASAVHGIPSSPDGQGLRRLTRKDGVAGSPSWSADGRRSWHYETDEVGASRWRRRRVANRARVDRLLEREHTTYTASRETKLSPACVSDGRISYIVRGGDDTAGLRIWYPNLRIVTLIPGVVRDPSWSPDGMHVVYQRVERLGGTEHLLQAASRDPDFEVRWSEPFAAFSKDGTRLLYSQYRPAKSAGTGLDTSSAGDTSIEIMNADGTAKRTLFYRDGFSAFSGVWSPAGNEIALSVGRYFRAAGLPPAQIALIKPDGSDFRLIVDDELNNGFPTWSPDGMRLAYKRGNQLVIMSLADRKVTPLTDGTYYDNFPQWSPKGDVIMFTSFRDGDFDLYTIRPDGTGLRRLTEAPGNDAH